MDLIEGQLPTKDKQDGDAKATLEAKTKKKTKKVSRALIEQTIGLEAGQPKTEPAPERIGQVLMSSEAINRPRDDSLKERLKEIKQNRREALDLTPKSVETVSRQELLEASSQIMVDGTSLRQIYENHLIGEKGLRRLVIEHLRGGDIKEALRQEVVEREIDFERDPDLRDMAVSAGLVDTPAASKAIDETTLKELINKAEAALPAHAEQSNFIKPYHRIKPPRQGKHLFDTLFVIITLALIAIIVLLYLKRH